MPDALELNVTTTTDATTIAETIFGDGIQVVSATLTGAATQAGTFSGGDATSGGVVPSDSGVILSTGNATDFTTGGTGTNTNTSAGTSTGHGGAGDADLDAISSTSTFDAVVFESTFIPDDDYITMQFVFSSEEYLEYVNSGVNDTLGVWVNGSFVPLTSSGDTVSIDTVNDSSNSNLYVDNPASADTYNTEMDGFTITLSFKAPVNPGEENTIRIGLADGGDSAYDTNVLIAADSIQTVALAFEDSVTMEANTTAVIDVLANDHDASGNGLTVTEINGQAVIPGQSVTLNTGETVTLNSDYTLSVAADSDLGETVFTYTVENGDGATDVGYVNIQTVADAPLDGIVEGSGAADVIDATFTGDPEGDMIDANDAIGVNGTTGDDDYVMAFGGDDTVQSGAGDDIVEAGSGDDVVAGGAGSDTLFGDEGNDTIHGGNDPSLGGGPPRSLNINNQSFEQTAHSDGQYSQGIPGWTVSVSGSGQAGDYNPTSSEINTGTVDGTDVAWIYHGGGSNSVAISQTLSETYTAGDTYSFSADVGDGAYSGSGDVPYQINIYAGTTLIGSTSGSTGNINALTNVTVDSTVVDPSLNGQAISIEIVQPPNGSGGELLIDNVVGTVTPAALPEDASGDLIDGGEGDDVIFGQGGDDTIALTDGFGNDTITGGETYETDGDTLDMSAVTSGVELVLSAADPEAGTVFETGSTGGATQFAEIENIILSAGRDIVHLADGGGQDAVGGFDISDSGDGTAVDQLDVSKLTSDGGTTPVTTTDVTVSSDPYGNAVLSYPGGESITLEGVNPLNLSTVDDLVAIGIPDGRDYIVEGSSGADTIDAGYAGDPEGDMVDNSDHSDGSDDDSIEAGAGDDSVLAGAGNDTVSGDAGSDTIEGGAGDDVLDGGADADAIYGQDGADSILGGAGADTLDGGAGNDTIWAGGGDDSVDGGADADRIMGEDGDDTIALSDGFGNDTILGGETSETDGDTLDLSATTTGVTVDLTSTDPEAGTVSDGTDTATFTEIENIILGGGRDTVVLADGSGADSVQSFDLTDSGDGTTNDQLDVSGLTSDGGSTPVTTADVTVSDDGNGNAVLSFPGGESITLVGVAPNQLNSVDALVSIGIPDGRDYIVEGTSGSDTIDAGYIGDPEGDMVDAGDAADGSNDDVIEAGAGDDSVLAGAGDDSVLADTGNDTVDGGTGADTIRGGTGEDSIDGGDGADDLYGDEDDDTILGGAGDDTIDGGLGADWIEGGDDNDSISGNDGDDTILGGAGDDWLRGSVGNDEMWGGTGDDYIWSGFNDDTIRIENDFGNDTIEAEGINEVTGDVLDLSLVTDDLTIDLTGSNPEAGTFSDGTSTAQFNEIENIILGGGRDTITLADFSGADSVQAFDMTNSGDGSTNDQLDVSGLTSDWGTTPIHAGDVTVSDDGNGNALLSFPGGESITLVGVDPSQLATEADLVSIGIPPAPDFIVEGTSGDDTIDAGYTGDPEGDMVDANDHSDGSNDDSIEAGGGNDSVVAGAGDDTVWGGNDAGADTILGGAGNDLINGQGGNDSIDGGADDDSIAAGAGDDFVTGGSGNDSINGGIGTDTLDGGTGADLISGAGGGDSILGGDDADTIMLFDGYGADTIAGGEGGVDADVLDASWIGADLELDLSANGAADNESGTLTSTTAGDVANFIEIESVVLGSGDDSVTGSSGDDSVATGAGADTVAGGQGDDNIALGANDGAQDVVVLSDGDGSDIVQQFEAPIDNGNGTYTGQDQLDVSGLTSDGGTTPVTTNDVTVGNDGFGNAVLSFPGGESITLVGVAPSEVDGVAELVAIGIPDGRDFIVEGTSGNDTIDVGYTGDPEGDMIDALDHSDGSNDDSVLADAGDDSVVAGLGDDTVFGQDGADTILGGSGNDSLDGDDVFANGGADSIDGGAGNDTLIGDSFDDTLIGGAGDDSIFAGADDDLVYAGTGDDQVFGEGGDDTVIVEDGFGNDTLIAGETSETDGDTLDLSNLTVDTTIDLTNANPEDVTITDGTDTINAEEFENLILGGGEDTLQLGDGGGNDLVAGFDMGDRGDGHTYDRLDVTGLTTDGTTPVTAWDVVVTDTNGDGSGDAILTFPGGESITLEGVAPNQVDTIPELFAIGIPCFTPGAMIITADGERPVEDIRPGDMVLTADNGFQPVRWVGSRTLGAADLAAQPELKPVVIRKGAFGNDRKMLVSPQHGFVMKTDTGERLIRAKHAAELYGGQIARIDRNCEQVTYVHIMFDRHEIVFAEGARTEAFYPGPQALKSIDREAMAELLTLFPELAHVAFGEDGAAGRYGPPARDYLLGRDIRAMKKGAVGAHPTRAA